MSIRLLFISFDFCNETFDLPASLPTGHDPIEIKEIIRERGIVERLAHHRHRAELFFIVDHRLPYPYRNTDVFVPRVEFRVSVEFKKGLLMFSL